MFRSLFVFSAVVAAAAAAPAGPTPSPPMVIENVIGGTPPVCGEFLIKPAAETQVEAVLGKGWVATSGSCAHGGFITKGTKKTGKLPAILLTALTKITGIPFSVTYYTTPPTADDVCKLKRAQCSNAGTCKVVTTAGGNAASCVCDDSSHSGAKCEVFAACSDSKALNFNSAATKMCAGCCTYAQSSACKGKAGTAGSTCGVNSKACVAVLGQVQCFCMGKAYGQRCEKVDTRDDCSPNPCSHGGACTDLFNGASLSYNCSCPSPWTSNRMSGTMQLDCNKRTNVAGTVYGCMSKTATNYNPAATADDGSCTMLSCFDNPCQNGGDCSQIFGQFACSCPAGYTGRTCSGFQTPPSAATPCNPTNGVNPCMNNGTCIGLPAGSMGPAGTVVAAPQALCLCSGNWGGSTCTTANSPPAPPACSSMEAIPCSGCLTAAGKTACNSAQCTVQFAAAQRSTFSGDCSDQSQCTKECQSGITAALEACNPCQQAKICKGGSVVNGACQPPGVLTCQAGRKPITFPFTDNKGVVVQRTFDSRAVNQLQSLAPPACDLSLGYEGCPKSCTLSSVQAQLYTPTQKCVNADGTWVQAGGCSLMCTGQFFNILGQCRGCNKDNNTDFALTQWLNTADKNRILCDKKCSTVPNTIALACCAHKSGCYNGIPPTCPANSDCATAVKTAAEQTCAGFFLGRTDMTGLYLDCGGDLSNLETIERGNVVKNGQTAVSWTFLEIMVGVALFGFIVFFFVGRRKGVKSGTMMEPIIGDSGDSIYGSGEAY